MNKKLSAASVRAKNYPNRDDKWLCTFRYIEANGLGEEEGVHRRDPSSVIKVGSKYYVYYTKSVGPLLYAYNRDKYFKKYPWDFADIYYATSKDGVNWHEKGIAVKRGKQGDYDDRTVCTPDILEYENKYYLVYQSISSKADYNGSNEKVAMAVAESPDGPFKKLPNTLLEPIPDKTKLFDDEDNYNAGLFDGRVHDPMLFHYKDKFYMYYKCCGNAKNDDGTRSKKYAGGDTRWGVAISDDILGPYIASEFNPITNSGHETLLWKYKGGIAALINRDGPEQNTIQFAKDGINFEVMAHTQFTPQAGGAYRCNETDEHPLAGINWGLCHVDLRGSKWNYIFRFDTLPINADTFPENYPPRRNNK